MPDETDAKQPEAAALAKFLSFLSHDLRGGLNGALLMLEVIKRQVSRSVAPAEIAEDLDVARKSILDTVTLMDRFILAERLRIGRANLLIESVAIGPLLQEIVQSHKAAALERGTAITLTAEPDLTVQADRQLLSNIVGNILGNAIKCGRGKPVEMRATAAPAAASSASVRIETIDLGSGIKPEVRAALDAPLVVEEPYDRKKGGMGLYIARRAAQLMNMDLTFQANDGGGTRVTLDLPQLGSATTR